MNGPDPDKRFPNGKVPSLCFIKNVITRPNIIVGDYTYYDDDTGAEDFEKHVTHHYEFKILCSGDISKIRDIKR